MVSKVNWFIDCNTGWWPFITILEISDPGYNLVSVVTIKTSNGYFKRSINRICFPRTDATENPSNLWTGAVKCGKVTSRLMEENPWWFDKDEVIAMTYINNLIKSLILTIIKIFLRIC